MMMIIIIMFTLGSYGVVVTCARYQRRNAYVGNTGRMNTVRAISKFKNKHHINVQNLELV